jgi:hypothetical protein
MSDETEEPTTPDTEPRLEPAFPFTFLSFDPGFIGVDTLPEDDSAT